MAENMEQNATTSAEQAAPERTFTQAEVDEIVKNRLSRVKQAPPDADQIKAAVEAATAEKEAELNKRAAQLDCRQFLIENDYPLEFMDAIDTADAEVFKERTARLMAAASRKRPKDIAPIGSGEPVARHSSIPAEMQRGYKHSPKDYYHSGG